MNSNSLPSDRIAIAAAIDPDATAPGTVATPWIGLTGFYSIMAVVMAGQLGVAATIDAKLEQATDGTGAGAKDVATKSITQLTQVGADSDKQAVINCRADELDISGDFTHVRLSVTVGTAASDIGALLLGLDARYEPVEQAAAVAEAVA